MLDRPRRILGVGDRIVVDLHDDIAFHEAEIAAHALGDAVDQRALPCLKAPLQPAFDAALAEVASDVGLSATGQTTWTFGTVEESVVQRRAGHEVRGYPALVDEGATVGLGVFGSADEAEARHRLGVRRLLLLGMRAVDPLAGLDNSAKLGLAGSPYPSVLHSGMLDGPLPPGADEEQPGRSPEDPNNPTPDWKRFGGKKPK